MAARGVEPSSYRVGILLDARYAPIIRRGSLRSEQPCPSTFPGRRAAGDTSIDLWVDGSIYPVDPGTERPPPFRTLRDCLEFICHGEQGLYGYARRLGLVDGGGPTQREMEMQCRHLEEELGKVRDDLAGILLGHNRDIEDTCMQLRVELETIRTEMSTMERNHRVTVQGLETEVRRWQQASERLPEGPSPLKDTPMGMRRRARPLRGIHELNHGSGWAKRRVKLVRTHLQPHLVDAVNDNNRVNHEKQRLHGDKASQTVTAVALAKILTRHEGLTLATQPSMEHVKRKIASNVLKAIGKRVGPSNILAACDQAGVSYRGYGAIYQAVKAPVRDLTKDAKSNILPSPYHVRRLRQELNANLPQFIGQYYHAEGRMELPAVSKKTKKSEEQRKEVVLDEKNSLFTDLEVVQQSMVIFYGITESGMHPLLLLLTAMVNVRLVPATALCVFNKGS